MTTIEELKDELDRIKERNARVEGDKAWETSMTRKVSIAILTYCVVVLFFLAAELPSAFINAIVPSIGFLLSTLSVSGLKKMWIARRKVLR